MERQCTRVYAEQYFPACNLNTSILEVESIVRGDSVGFGSGFIVRAVSDREVGHGGDAGRWRRRG